MHSRYPDPAAQCCALHCEARRRGTRDRLFERLLAHFRDHLLQALRDEPEGHDRHLRAYVRCLHGQALQPGACRRSWALLLGSPPYTTIWREFADEACAGDALDPAQSRARRQAAEELWYNRALAPSPRAPTPGALRATAACVAQNPAQPPCHRPGL